MLFYEDLVYALKYSLVTEVGLHSDISADALTALKGYVSILSKVTFQQILPSPVLTLKDAEYRR